MYFSLAVLFHGCLLRCEDPLFREWKISVTLIVIHTLLLERESALLSCIPMSHNRRIETQLLPRSCRIKALHISDALNILVCLYYAAGVQYSGLLSSSNQQKFCQYLKHFQISGYRNWDLYNVSTPHSSQYKYKQLTFPV